MSRPNRSRDRQWHPEQIKAEVRMRGETLTGLALKRGLAESACRDALRTRRPKAEAAIAALIQVPKEELWPDRYAKGAASTDVDTATPTAPHRQIAGAR